MILQVEIVGKTEASTRKTSLGNNLPAMTGRNDSVYKVMFLRTNVKSVLDKNIIRKRNLQI